LNDHPAWVKLAGRPVGAFKAWLGSSRDAAKTAPPPQPARHCKWLYNKRLHNQLLYNQLLAPRPYRPPRCRAGGVDAVASVDGARSCKPGEGNRAAQGQSRTNGPRQCEPRRAAQVKSGAIDPHCCPAFRATQGQPGPASARQCEHRRADQGNPGTIGPRHYPGFRAECAAQDSRGAATASSSCGAQARADTLAATSHNPAERKTKIVIDVAAADALGPFLHRPCRPHYDEQPIGFIHSRPSAILGYFISEVPVSRVRFAARIGRGNRTIFVWDVCGDRERVGFEPKVKCHVQGFDSGSYPPISFPTGAVQFAMMGATAIHHCQSARLRKAQMVRVAGTLVGSRGRAAWLQSVP
jgi:hypothetical protein